ncbi:hypothetical protein [Winogradskyella sp. R77965]|uniref:hypothetical protein n=1 Tax=Winogradskyella sp. R77965 TaxID=3093872 RepID=UPI0037DC741B
MELTKEDVQFIDDFLKKKGVKYLDVRSELLDHLATEFEEKSNYSLIEDYLISKVEFIRDFAKKQRKAIHWGYQKQLWIQLGKFFYKPKFLLLLFGLIGLGYMFLQFFNLKEFGFVCYFILLILVFYPLLYQMIYYKAVKKVQSIQSLFTVTSLPMVLLHSSLLIKDLLGESSLLIIIYWAFSILLGLSAAIIIEKDREKVLEKYYQLINRE